MIEIETNTQQKEIMKPVLHTILLCAVLSAQAAAQDASIFPKGERSSADNHTGTVWLKELNEPDSTFKYSIAVATFEPGAKLDWHIHPAGQILLITDGIGYYQEKGKPIQIVRKGDVIKCVPGVEHWHGASPESGFTYIATTPAQKGATVWLKRVTDDEYHHVNRPAVSSTNTEQEIISLSREKWRWMAERKVDTLASLFHEKAVFVHMGGTMTRDQELNVIKSGAIQYKHADIQETSVRFIGNTAILLNKIRLIAVVGGNEVTNSFVVTEVYVKQSGTWTLASLSFTRLLTQ
jgi:4-carboxymuconolactone decarboxylase